MDRAPYRRVTPPRRNRETYSHRTSRYTPHSPPDDRAVTRGETLLAQTIISGILMLVVLMICVVDIAPLVSMRAGLRQVLAGATNVEEVVADVRRFNQDWLAGDTEEYQPALSIPVNPPILDRPPPNSNSPLSNPQFSPDSNSPLLNPQPSPESNLPLHIQSEPTFHIYQEDHPLTAEEAPSNPQIPGPSTVPGLWD